MCSTTQNKNRNISYFDGSGNSFKVSYGNKIILEYWPVKPSLSSSGIFDGGDYKKIQLNSSEYNEIASLAEKAASNKSIHIKKRILTSGLVVIQDNSRYILKPDSMEMTLLEKKLREIIK